MFIDFREEGRERERDINDERSFNWLPPANPWLGTEPTTPGMCLDWELNCDFLVHRSRFNHCATLARQALCHFSWGCIEACHLRCPHLSSSPSSSSCVCYWQNDSFSNVKLGGRITDWGRLCPEPWYVPYHSLTYVVSTEVSTGGQNSDLKTFFE